MANKEQTDHIVFARKYRPSSWKEVVGQDHVINVLINAIAQDRVAHAYLFAGPRGTGKTTVARILAKELKCESEDIIEIDAASSRGIDEARALRDAVRFLPMRSPKKVYIIDEVHMLTKEAFNALLKTLEEPPEHAVFVLATTEPEKVLDTIVSRTQHFTFHKISIPDIVKELDRIAKAEEFEIADDALKFIAFLADGSLRDAENILLQVQSTGRKEISEDDVRLMLGAPPEKATNVIMERALKKETAQMLEAFDETMRQGIDPQMLGKLMLRNFRAMYFLALDPTTAALLSAEFSNEEIEKLKQYVNTVPDNRAQTLEHAVGHLLNALRMPTDDFLPQLPLELALIKIATE